MRYIVFCVALVSSLSTSYGQELQLPSNDSTDYYYKIPDYPESYTSGNVAARVVDGLGFRYYWATHGLRAQDLSFKPTDEARTTNETLDHLYILTLVTYNAVSGESNKTNPSPEQWGFEEKRAKTLDNIKRTSELLKRSSASDLENYTSTIGKSEYPFWNMLNGPIADALWHVGQVVSFRRSSGNPLNLNASMLRGRLRN